MIDPNEVGGPVGPQFRQSEGSDLAPPQASPQVAQGLRQQQGVLPNQHTFFIRFTSPIDGKVYEGQFASKKLSVKDLGQLGVRKIQLNGGYHYDEKNPGQGIEEHIDQLNSMIAHLEISLIQWPVWFDLNQIYEAELITKVYEKVAEFENSFFRRRDEAGPGRGVPTDRGPANQGAPAGGSVTPVGGGSVQPSLDP